MIVIPAPYQVRGKLQPESGFPVKTGTQSLKWFPTFVGTTPSHRLPPVRRLFYETIRIEKVVFSPLFRTFR
jgi:hypothetical protein